MSDIVNGIPEPRVVLLKNNIVVDDFTLADFEAGTDASEYLTFEEDFLSSTLWSREIVSMLRGFRMKLTLSWPHGLGDELIKMKMLFDRRAYDTIHFYPWATDKPYYREVMKLTDDARTLAYSYHLAHHNFMLTLESVNLVDYIPLEQPEFLTWGNITLRFSDLGTLAYSSYMRLVTQSNSTGGTIRADTSGYFQIPSPFSEAVGGSLAGNGTFKTDVGTHVTFKAIPDVGKVFDHWVINSVVTPGPEELSLIVMAALTIQPIFV